MIKLCCFAPVIVAMVILNYRVDPAHVFDGEKYARDVAKILLQGQNAANVGDLDERLLQKCCTEGLTERRDVVVLGSSRTMQVRAWAFRGRTFFNSSFSLATIGELVATYQLYLERDMEPSTVVIGIDPWMFNARFTGAVRSTLAAPRDAGMRRLGMPASCPALRSALCFCQPYLQLFSPSYLQATLKAAGSPSRRRYTPTTSQEEEGPVRLSDGSYSYGREKRTQSAAQIRREIASDKPVAGDSAYAGFRDLDPDLCRLLAAFVADLERRGVDVVVFLAPFHPAEYAKMMASEQRECIIGAQRYVVSLAREKGATVVGSFDPADLTCGESDFYDGCHPKADFVARIIRAAEMSR